MKRNSRFKSQLWGWAWIQQCYPLIQHGWQRKIWTYEKIDGKIIEPNVLRDFPERQVKLLEVLPEIVDMSKVGASCRVRNLLTTYQKMSTSWGRFAHIPGIWVLNSIHTAAICWLRPGLPKLQYHQYPSFTGNSTNFLWRAMFCFFRFRFPAWLCGFCGFCGCVAFVALPCFAYLPIYLSNLT